VTTHSAAPRTTIGRISLKRREVARTAGPLPRPLTTRATGPFLKWAGGKTKLMAQLNPLLPKAVDRMRHIEPFVGGGGFFFARLPGRAVLSDVNEALVDTYLAVRDEVENVLDVLTGLNLAHAAGGAYYPVRDRYNQRDASTSRAERAAMFIYLNKTCFNGLHRVNKKGAFNVPEGRYASPRILDETGLRLASAALRAADIRCAPYESLLDTVRPGDFVYLDPPYAPLSDTASFTAYADDGFSMKDQERLRDVVAELDRRGASIMLSNHDVPAIRRLYERFRIDVVHAPRAIGASAQSRGAVAEVVVRNY
jgi:DNA adenine methylase